MMSTNATSDTTAKDKALAFNTDRAKWRVRVTEARKEYAKEVAQRVSDETQRKAEELAELKLKKAARMRDRLARSAETAKRIAAERAATKEAFESRLAFTDSVREGRQRDEAARQAAMVAFLEEQAGKWLTPARVDKEIDEAFLADDGAVAGFSAERSPYWGYVADVEPLPYKKPQPAGVARAERVEGGSARSKKASMALAAGLMYSYAANYREYKQMREDPAGNNDDFFGVLQGLEVTDESNSERKEPLTMAGLRGGSGGVAGGFLSRAGPGGQGPMGYLGGGVYGSSRPPMPRIQPEEHDKQVVAEQLARLRARRNRPTPEAEGAAGAGPVPTGASPPPP